jgi:hypothetical protein
VGIFPDELRLAITLGLNGLLAFAAYRFARRWVADRLQAALDAFLIWYLVQYLVVAGLGVPGVLGGAAIVIVGAIVAAALLVVARKEAPHVHAGLRLHPTFLGATFVLIAYLISIIWGVRYAPTTANDSLAYQLPAAVQWLQTGRLALLPVWFFNPANSYSPLAGSTFVVWLMGPMGNDVLARFVEAPALLFLFLGVVQLCRALGASITVAALLGLTVACARPFISQTILAKDDLPLAAFLVAAMVGLSAERLRDALGPWRLGAAVGLLLATKFTATFSLPAVLLAIDAPWRAGWRWRKHLIAAGFSVLLFAPWYARNWICYGSPAFPFNISVLGFHLFNGPLTTIRTDRMNSVHGIIDTLTGTYYSLPASLAVLVVVAWVIALCHGHLARVLGFADGDTGKMPVAQVLSRACLFGPMLAIVLFITRSPAAEMRFIAPSLAVLIASCAVLFVSWPRFALVAAALLAATSLFTGFTLNGLESLAPVTLILVGLFIAAFFVLSALNRAGRLAVAILVFITVIIWTYIAWPSYLNICRVEATAAWSVPYGELADGWGAIRDQTEPDCTIAYTNTIQIYPLFGFDLGRHLVYAPTRPGLHRLDQLPPMRPVIGEEVPGEVARTMMDGGDEKTWLENLKQSGANYLFIAKQNLADPSERVHPPELGYVSDQHFQRMFENAAVSVYRVNW